MSDTIDLDSPEVKKAIADAVADEVAGLKAKNGELLGQIKTLKKGQQVDPADVEKLEAEIDALRAKAADAEKAAKKATQDAEKAAKAQADAEGSVDKLLVDNGLNDALAKAGVTNPALVKAAKAMFASQAQVVDDNGNKVARIGDKPLPDAISEWAGSDEGKHFVTAADVSGGGSQGGRNRSGAPVKEISRAAFDALDPAARSAHFQGGGIVTD
jgi:hypothetical protein